MRRLFNPLIALLLALLLVSGQQGALAHMLAHAAGGAQTLTAQEDDSSHGTALTLSQVCTTCIAFAGAGAAPLAASSAWLPAPGEIAHPAIAVSPAPTIRFVAAYRSRAPPPL